MLMFIYAAPARDSLPGLVVFALVACVGGAAITKWAVLRRLRARADYGSEFEVTLAAGGITAKGAHVSGKWEWPAYPEAVRFADGLLLQRPGVIRWLPDSGLIQGSPSEVTALVACMSTVRHVA